MTVLASGIILYRAGSLRQEPLLLLLRNRETGQWGFPKGRRDAGDANEVVTALREVHEETGYTGLALHPAFRCCIEYVVRGTDDDGRDKRVVYFLAAAPPGDPRLSAEHDAFRWVDGQGLAELLLYAQLRDLGHHALASIAQAGSRR